MLRKKNVCLTLLLEVILREHEVVIWVLLSCFEEKFLRRVGFFDCHVQPVWGDMDNSVLDDAGFNLFKELAQFHEIHIKMEIAMDEREEVDVGMMNFLHQFSSIHIQDFIQVYVMLLQVMALVTLTRK